MAVTAPCVAQLTGRSYLGAFALTALALSLWRFFLPVLFELNAGGVHQRILGRRRHVPWKSIHRCEIFADGVLLLPMADRCALDALRGLYLPWGGHRDEVLANVRYYLPVNADGRPDIAVSGKTGTWALINEGAK
jgi:hypothetical protein